MTTNRHPHVQKVGVAAFLALSALVHSCGIPVGLDDAGHNDRTPAELMTEIEAAREEATACRKVIDKPLRCLP